jgi:hypothetical protein
MPVAQFNPFERVDKPSCRLAVRQKPIKSWHRLCDERNGYLEGVERELIGESKTEKVRS